MKSFKKILGVLVTVALVASMVIPVLPVSAGTLAWTTVTTPSGTNSTLLAASDVSVMAVAPDNKTIFAYDNVGDALYKSTDGGIKWSTTNIGTNLEADASPVVAMAVSRNFATDSIVLAAVGAAGAANNKVYRSQNGGSSFGEVSSALFQAMLTATEIITSIDVCTYYTGGELAILVGTKDTVAAAFGSVYLCRLDTWTWSDQGALAGWNANDVYAVKFSPNHQADAQIMAVGATAVAGTGTILQTKSAANNWSADVIQVDIDGGANSVDETMLTNATIAFPSDWEWSSANKLFVGITSTSATLDDVYRVANALPGGTASSTDLNVNGSTTECQVYSIDVNGAYVGSTVIVGQTASNTVKKTTDPSVSTVSWTSTVKAPYGAANVAVAFGTDTNTVYAGTTGAQSGFAVSKDGASTFNQTGLIETSALANLRYKSVSVLDASNIYLLVWDDADGGNDIDAGEVQSVFKSTDGGATYARVLVGVGAAGTGIYWVQASPQHASDNTVYVIENTTRIWKSTSGGDKWVGLAAPVAITAFKAISGDTYFTGHTPTATTGGVYKSGRWNSETNIPATDAVVSIAVSPNFATDDTVVIGTSQGQVYYSVNASATTGVTYTRIGAANELGLGNNIFIALHPDFATNQTIFAGSDQASAAGGTGSFRWVLGSTQSTWLNIDAGAAAIVTPATAAVQLRASALVVSPDGTLYAANRTAVVGAAPTVNEGMRRAVSPTAASAASYASESVGGGLGGGAAMQTLSYITGSNILYSIVNGLAASTTYPHGYSLVTYTDTFSTTPVQTAPADNFTTAKTTVEFAWEKLEAPASTTVTYTIDVAYDSTFANKVVNGVTTTGANYIATGLTPGQQYYWRVYVAAGNPLATRKPSRMFTVVLGRPTISASDYSRQDVILNPTIVWQAVEGATGYRFEIAESPDFKTGLVSKLLDVAFSTVGPLKYNTTYYWRVKALSAKTESAWTEAAFRTMVEPAKTTPPVVVTQAPPAPAPIITVPAPVTVTIPPPAPATTITPSWIYAIIVVGAILVIAVIVLIVRTRRVM